MTPHLTVSGVAISNILVKKSFCQAPEAVNMKKHDQIELLLLQF